MKQTAVAGCINRQDDERNGIQNKRKAQPLPETQAPFGCPPHALILTFLVRAFNDPRCRNRLDPPHNGQKYARHRRMSYEVTWLPGTKELLETAFPSMKPADRRDWFVRKVIDHLTQEIAAYPQDASAQPGQRVRGELQFGAFCVRYEIQMDKGVANVTEVVREEKRRTD